MKLSTILPTILLLQLLSAQTIYFHDDFEGPVQTNWQGGNWSLELGKTGKALGVQVAASGQTIDNRITVSLDPAAIAGKKIILSGWVRADKISAKTKPYLGGKLMLVLTKEDGQTSYPQADVEVGSFDWTLVYRKIEIPTNLKAATLVLGLEGVTGKISFDDITLEDFSSDKVESLRRLAIQQGEVFIPPTNWKATIRVGAKVFAQVNSLVFGGNIEAWTPTFFTYRGSYGRTAGGLWNPISNTVREEAVSFLRQTGLSILRYPGGSLVNGFEWKKTIGPTNERPDNVFGLDEYLAACKGISCQPLITVADYIGTAQDAADLVEYLNAPVDASHPWAQKRAANGHADPWAVRYFELGNETYAGNAPMKPFRKMSAAEYGDWTHGYFKAMKSVDPSIKIGTLIDITDDWTDVVLAKVKDEADFIIDHIYPAGIWGEGTLAAEITNRVTRAVVAATQDAEEHLAERCARIKRITGRTIPLAITEYNGGQANQQPIPYRFTLGTALFAGDFRRVMQKPEHSILLANYWQSIGGYWGMVRANDPTLLQKENKIAWTPSAAFYVFRLWAKHTGVDQLRVDVHGPADTFEGFLGVSPRGGDSGKSPFEPLTVFASLSADRKMIYLLVFNKHSKNNIETGIEFEGKPIRSAKIWIVTGPSLASWNEIGKPESVTETKSGEEIATTGNSLKYIFPARSMSAVDLEIVP